MPFESTPVSGCSPDRCQAVFCQSFSRIYIHVSIYESVIFPFVCVCQNIVLLLLFSDLDFVLNGSPAFHVGIYRAMLFYYFYLSHCMGMSYF